MKQTDLEKKNKHVQWLFRDHYNGLLVVCKLRKALRCHTTIAAIAGYISEQYKSHLQPHFLEEEALLFPKLACHDPLRLQAEMQHNQLRKIIALMIDDPINHADLAAQFADLLEDHITFEERTLFPAIEKELNACLPCIKDREKQGWKCK